MSPWLVLIPVSLLFATGAIFSYNAELRASRWFVPVYLAVSIGCAIFWIVATRQLNDATQIYFLSLVWDFLMVVCYYILPLILYEMKLSGWTMFGVGLMMAGLVVVKVKG